MGLELQSLALYVLAAFNRDSLRSTEAGLKYFVLGALSSGMLLYGISLIYGFTGTTDFARRRRASSRNRARIDRPDLRPRVPDRRASRSRSPPCRSTCGRPTSMKARPRRSPRFFAMAPKVAAMALFLRALLDAVPGRHPQWQQIVIFVSVLSMVLGAVAAIGQTNIKRLMAYSSIGHMGYALLGLAAGTTAGVQGVLIYLTIYRRHQCRRVCLHPGHAARWRDGRDDRRSRRALRARSRARASPSRCSC